MTEEGDRQRAILDYLHLRGILHWRNQSHPVPGRRFTGLKGVADIIAVHRGVCYGIEVKSAKGKLSDDQGAFQIRLVNAGGVYIVARSVDDVIEALASTRRERG